MAQELPLLLSVLLHGPGRLNIAWYIYGYVVVPVSGHISPGKGVSILGIAIVSVAKRHSHVLVECAQSLPASPRQEYLHTDGRATQREQRAVGV
jgi:hypothetical protein